MTRIQCAVILAAGLLAATPPVSAQQHWVRPDSALLQRARLLLESAPLVDGHNDLPSRLMEQYGGSVDSADFSQRQPTLPADIPRLRAGRVGAQFWAAHPRVDPAQGPLALRNGIESVDLVHRLIAHYPALELARTADDIERITRSGKIASLVALEGGHAIANSLAALRMFYDLDVRYMTLTHDRTNDWADASTDFPRHQGLSTFGRSVVLEMNRLGMFVDLSHTSDETSEEVMRISRAPVLLSHSNTRAINPHPRNVPDRVLRLLAKNGGVIMVNFVAGYVAPTTKAWEEWCRAREQRACVPTGRGIDEPLWTVRKDSVAKALRASGRSEQEVARGVADWVRQTPAPRGTVSDVADHIDHIRDVAGIDHIGIGSDFFDPGGASMAEGLDDASMFPNLFAELMRRGYSDADLRKIAGQNLLRAMRQMELVSRQLRSAERQSPRPVGAR